MIQPVSGLGSWASVWQEFKDFWNPDLSTPDYIRRNIWAPATPDYVPAKPSGPVVPSGALTSPNQPYVDQYVWCNVTDTDCLNRGEAAKADEVWDAQRNMIGYRKSQLDAIAQAESDFATDKEKQQQEMMSYVIAAAILIGVVWFAKD